MNYDPIIIVAGEPNSVFLEIFFKSIRKKISKSPIILIASKKIIMMQMKRLNFNYKLNLIDAEKLKKTNLSFKKINLINVKFNQHTAFKKISSKSNLYIKNSFELAFKLIKKGISKKLINGPISKKYFLKKNHLGITEYLAEKFKSKSNAMLIYNKKLSVCPLTTHVPIKLVSGSINQNLLTQKIALIDNFYKANLKIKPKIAITGLNPHCESILKYNEDEKIITPLVKELKKKYNLNGPFPADTIFLKENRRKFNVIIGMYHDQVLTPLKTLFEYDAINITLGLPFMRISPDHGPNEKMIGKNMSNPLSLIQAIKFLNKID